MGLNPPMIPTDLLPRHRPLRVLGMAGVSHDWQQDTVTGESDEKEGLLDFGCLRWDFCG
jgi:hypothetical protein